MWRCWCRAAFWCSCSDCSILALTEFRSCLHRSCFSGCFAIAPSEHTTSLFSTPALFAHYPPTTSTTSSRCQARMVGLLLVASSSVSLVSHLSQFSQFSQFLYDNQFLVIINAPTGIVFVDLEIHVRGEYPSRRNPDPFSHLVQVSNFGYFAERLYKHAYLIFGLTHAGSEAMYADLGHFSPRSIKVKQPS